MATKKKNQKDVMLTEHFAASTTLPMPSRLTT